MERLLSQLEQQVKDCERRIVKQLEIIDLLTGMGRDTSRAARLLYAFEDARDLKIAYRDRVSAQLRRVYKPAAS
jgi:hypothetical protein